MGFKLYRKKRNTSKNVKTNVNIKTKKPVKKRIYKIKSFIKTYCSNQFFRDHPYFNTMFQDNNDINLKCPELLDNIDYVGYQRDVSNDDTDNNDADNESHNGDVTNMTTVTVSKLSKKINMKKFNTIYTFS